MGNSRSSLSRALLTLFVATLALLLVIQTALAIEEEQGQGTPSPAHAAEKRHYRIPRNIVSSPEPVLIMPDVRGKFSSEAFTCMEKGGIMKWSVIEVQSRSNFDRIVEQKPYPGGRVNLKADSQAVLFVARPFRSPEPLLKSGENSPVSPPRQGFGPAVVIAIIGAQVAVLFLIFHLLQKVKSTAPRSRIILSPQPALPSKQQADVQRKG
jgi:hypothetical protein